MQIENFNYFSQIPERFLSKKVNQAEAVALLVKPPKLFKEVFQNSFKIHLLLQFL